MRGLLYPKSYFGNSTPDEAFEVEYEVAKSLMIPVAFYDQESLTFDEKVKILNVDTSIDSYVYRGWMLSESEYKKLETSLESKGSMLTVSTEEYLKSHSFENWFPEFESLTFPSVIINDPTNAAELEHAINFLGATKFFVKDFVKSIQDPEASIANSPEELPFTIKNYLQEREEYLNGKIVVRKFVELDNTVAEIRTWWVNGALVLISSHPNFINKPEPNLESLTESLATIEVAVHNFGEFFLSVDLARTLDGQWVIVEVGNGQVSGLPSNLTEDELTTLLTRLNSR